jgi:hypothetical protein
MLKYGKVLVSLVRIALQFTVKVFSLYTLQSFAGTARSSSSHSLILTLSATMGLWNLLTSFFSSIGAGALWRSSRDLKILILLRFVRLLGYGGTTFVLALYLNALGFEDTQIGLFMTLTLVGDLAISFVLTYVGDRMGVRVTAAIGAMLMCAGGGAFVFLDNFWLLLLASIVAVINPR